MAIRYGILYTQTREMSSQINPEPNQRRHAMKEKVGKAVQLMIAITMEDIGFFIACGIALAVILKLACV